MAYNINIDRETEMSLFLEDLIPSPLLKPYIKFKFLFFRSDCEVYIQDQESTTPHFLEYLPLSATRTTSAVVESLSYEDIREAVRKSTFLLRENEHEGCLDFACEKVRENIPTGTLPEDKFLLLCFSIRIKYKAVLTVESDYPRMIPASDSSFALLEKFEVDRKKEERDCCICLEGLGDGEGALRMPCSHVFHGGCIEKWLTTSHYCPLCRYEMPIEADLGGC